MTPSKLYQRSKLKQTASALNGSPSWNVTSSRSSNVQSRPSSLNRGGSRMTGSEDAPNTSWPPATSPESPPSSPSSSPPHEASTRAPATTAETAANLRDRLVVRISHLTQSSTVRAHP